LLDRQEIGLGERCGAPPPKAACPQGLPSSVVAGAPTNSWRQIRRDIA
jgi:hypothetical protein